MRMNELEEEPKLLTRKQFSELVVKRKREKEITAIEAVLDICEERMIDPEDVKTLIDSTLKGMIEEEALSLNMIKGSRASLASFL
jgi:type II restriction/modification system DNA methylase subunit YeeA